MYSSDQCFFFNFHTNELLNMNTPVKTHIIPCPFFQLVLCGVSVFIAWPEPVLRMPVPTARYAETLCNLPPAALLPPLAANLLQLMGRFNLVFVCSFFVYFIISYLSMSNDLSCR